MNAIRLPEPRTYPERAPLREAPLDRAAHHAIARLKAATSRSRGTWLAEIHGPVAIAGETLRALSDAALLNTAREAGLALRADPAWPQPALAQALAITREAASRALGLTPFDSQITGAHAALRGMAAEMATGEGKTLAATIAACVAGLAGTPVHVVTVNRYLADRDAAEMGPLYRFLGLGIGLVTEAVPAAARAREYSHPITICTNKDVAFDYMRDRLTMGRLRSDLRHKMARLAGSARAEGLLLRGLHFAIVDEADSVLIDEARTPLILSRDLPDDRDTALFDTALDIAARLRPGLDCALFRRERQVALLPPGEAFLERLASSGPPWDQPAERRRLVTQALHALHMLNRDEHYLVRDGKCEIIDEFSGRILPDRTWSDGLQEMVDRKEGLALNPHRSTIARTTYQRFYRRYLRLAGMSGTLQEVAGELWRVYRLPVARVALHRPDRKSIEPALGFATEAEKWRAIASRVATAHATGQPVLIGTRTVEASLRASAVLRDHGIDHRVLNAAQDGREAEIIAQAGREGAVTVATNMAGRGTDIRLAPDMAARGGLCVVASESHEAGRIDRQLAGRCGRQGDPGTVAAFVSWQDSLLAAHAPIWSVALAALPASWRAHCAVILARMAQRRAEWLHAGMREDLLRAEESLGEAIAFAGEPQ